MTTNGGTMSHEDRTEALHAFHETLRNLRAVADSDTSDSRAGAALEQIALAILSIRDGLRLAGEPADLTELYHELCSVELGLELEHAFQLSSGMREATRVELLRAELTMSKLFAAHCIAA